MIAVCGRCGERVVYRGERALVERPRSIEDAHIDTDREGAIYVVCAYCASLPSSWPAWCPQGVQA